MLPLKDCRGYRSRYINALNRAVRALTPIAGRGIRLRQSAQGVVIEAIAKGGGGGTVVPFSYRWKVTLSTSTDEVGTTIYTMKIAPGSLWRDEGTGAVELNVQPDGSTVKTSATGWLAEDVGTGALYVVEDTSGGSAVYRVVYGDPTSETRRILLRVADLTLASSGATLTQRQIGDALTGGASGLQLGPLTYETDGDTKRFVRYMGAWTFDADNDRWTFAKAVKTDGLPYPAAEVLAAEETLVRDGGNIHLALRPAIGPDPTLWLSKRTSGIATGITYDEPASDSNTGAIIAHNAKITYYSDEAAETVADETLLYTQVEAANEAAHFEA